MAVRYIETCRLPTPFGVFDMHGFEEPDTGKEHVALTLGDIDSAEPLLARTHSECLTGDALYSMRCDCGYQLEEALRSIAREGRGILMYLRQEGRGIGLINKIRAYHLQDQGMDTVEANEHLGFDADMRTYEMCKVMLDKLNVKNVELMTNNPRKTAALKDLDINVVARKPIDHGITKDNKNYIKTKTEKLGHAFDPHILGD